MAKQSSTLQIRGKLGNVVGFGRTAAKKSGTNFARIHQPNVKDAKTDSQLVQRAITATVSQAYKQMKVICNHSFEKKSVGSESQQYFRKQNMNRLRAAILNDFVNDTAPYLQEGAVVAPNSNCAAPFAFQVSEGTLVQNLFHLQFVDNVFGAALLPPSHQETTVAQYMRERNVATNDIFTIIGLGALDGDWAFRSQYGDFASQPRTSFGFIRLRVKDNIWHNDALMSAVNISDLFDISLGGVALDPSDVAATDDTNANIISTDLICQAETGFIGIIRSKENSKKRSTCILQTYNMQDADFGYASNYGIKSTYILNAWRREQDQLGQSNLILEGGSINGDNNNPYQPEPTYNLIVGQMFVSYNGVSKKAMIAWYEGQVYLLMVYHEQASDRMITVNEGSNSFEELSAAYDAHLPVLTCTIGNSGEGSNDILTVPSLNNYVINIADSDDWLSKEYINELENPLFPLQNKLDCVVSVVRTSGTASFLVSAGKAYPLVSINDTSKHVDISNAAGYVLIDYDMEDYVDMHQNNITAGSCYMIVNDGADIQLSNNIQIGEFSQFFNQYGIALQRFAYIQVTYNVPHDWNYPFAGTVGGE